MRTVRLVLKATTAPGAPRTTTICPDRGSRRRKEIMTKMTTRLSLRLRSARCSRVTLAGGLERRTASPDDGARSSALGRREAPGCFNNDPAGLRFVDCGNGTVQDTQTGLIWLKNANCLPAGE
jgi:hypothetical protein